MARVSTTTIQQALTAYAQYGPEGRARPSPGRIDGLWGPNTAASLEGYIMTVAAGDPAMLSAWIEAEPRASSVEMPDWLASGINTWAQRYRAEQGDPTATPTVATQTALMTRGPALLPWIGLGVIAVGVGWWFWTRMR